MRDNTQRSDIQNLFKRFKEYQRNPLEEEPFKTALIKLRNKIAPKSLKDLFIENFKGFIEIKDLEENFINPLVILSQALKEYDIIQEDQKDQEEKLKNIASQIAQVRLEVKELEESIEEKETEIEEINKLVSASPIPQEVLDEQVGETMKKMGLLPKDREVLRGHVTKSDKTRVTQGIKLAEMVNEIEKNLPSLEDSSEEVKLMIEKAKKILKKGIESKLYQIIELSKGIQKILMDQEENLSEEVKLMIKKAEEILEKCMKSKLDQVIELSKAVQKVLMCQEENLSGLNIPSDQADLMIEKAKEVLQSRKDRQIQRTKEFQEAQKAKSNQLELKLQKLKEAKESLASKENLKTELYQENIKLRKIQEAYIVRKDQKHQEIQKILEELEYDRCKLNKSIKFLQKAIAYELIVFIVVSPMEALKKIYRKICSNTSKKEDQELSLTQVKEFEKRPITERLKDKLKTNQRSCRRVRNMEQTGVKSLF